MDPIVSFGLDLRTDRLSQLVFILVTSGSGIPVSKILYLKYDNGTVDPNFAASAKRGGGEDLVATLSQLAPHVGNGELFLKSALLFIAIRSNHPWCALRTEEEIMSATAEIRVILAQIFPPRTQFVFEPRAHGLAMIGNMLSA